MWGSGGVFEKAYGGWWFVVLRERMADGDWMRRCGAAAGLSGRLTVAGGVWDSGGGFGKAAGD